MASGYQYDVFVSYRHKQPVLDWLKYNFYPLLERWLPECMPIDHEPKIFIDWSIETGSDWPTVLCQALKQSRCLLPIWSPQYFRSKWCLAELYTMLERERKLGLRTSKSPSGLIYPVIFADGEHFPDEIKNIQFRDLRKWNSHFPSFNKTTEIVYFEQEVQYLCNELALMIRHAPGWKNWPVVTPNKTRKINVKLPRL